MNPVRWEYKVEVYGVRASQDMQVYLNELGSQGWEIVHVEFVSFASGHSTFNYIFKRPLVEAPAPAPMVEKPAKAKGK